MAKINRYDTPAESNYFNTFVPLPLDQITALGMKRQEDLERKQDMFSRSVDDASMIDYVPGSVDESRVKNEFLPQIQKLAEEAMSIDLSNPVEWAKYSTKIKRLSVSDEIKRIEQSSAGYKQALAIANEQRMRGVYNPLLDDTLKRAQSLDSRNEIFNYVPESQIDKSKLFEPYYKDIGQDYSARVNVGTKDNPLWVLRQGISDNKIRAIGTKAAQDLAATGGGNQIVRLARMENPALYADMSDREILESQMYEYGKSRSDFRDQILSDNMQSGAGGGDGDPKEWKANPHAIPGGNTQADPYNINDVLDYDFATSTSTTDNWQHNPYGFSSGAARLTDVRNAMRNDEYQGMLKKREDAISIIIEKNPHMAYAPDGVTKLSDAEILKNYQRAGKKRMDSATFIPNDLDVLEYSQKMMEKTFNTSRIVVAGINQSFSPHELAKELNFENATELLENIEALGPSFNLAGGMSGSVSLKDDKSKVAKAIAAGGNEIVITGNLEVDRAMKPLNHIRQMVDLGKSGRIPITEDTEETKGKYVNIDYDYDYINGEPTFIPKYTIEQKIGKNQFEPVMTKTKNGDIVPAVTNLQGLYEFSLGSIYGPRKTFDPNKTTPSKGLTYYSD